MIKIFIVLFSVAFISCGIIGDGLIGNEPDKINDLPKSSFIRVSPKNTKPLTVYVGDKITLEYRVMQ